MKGYKMYTQIKHLKDKGFTRHWVAKQLGIHRKTVSRYWDMSVDEYEENLHCISKHSLLSKYDDVLISWLTQFPAMSAAQVCDWLKEHYNAHFKERTVSRYVKQLRNDNGISKSSVPRMFEAVADMPPGKQMQVDFGEEWLTRADGKRIKVYFAAFVLSHSRYKYALFQNRPYTSVDLVNACNSCFHFMDGMPQELVFDQDSIVSISENYGDIIHTYEFEKFRQELGFSVYLCKKSDPQSKGKVESCVKFIKYNFLKHRTYIDDETLNNCAIAWLERTGNGKVHSVIKKIPADVFSDEREYLKPIQPLSEQPENQLLRVVRKDNTILYDSNRYSVPLGTYHNQKEVRLKINGENIVISTTSGEFICEHILSKSRGALVKNSNHSRDTKTALDDIQSKTDLLLKCQATDFLQIIRVEKSRYARDQFHLLQLLCQDYSVDETLSAIEFCKKNRLNSATYAKGFLEHKPKKEVAVLPIPVSDKKYHVTCEKRSIDVYAKVGECQ